MIRPEEKPRSSLTRTDGAWLLAYVPLTVLFTWPLAPRLTSALAGNHGDAWQSLWNIGWLRTALTTGQNPFYTHSLWYPDGTTLVFQTFDLPDSLVAAGLLGLTGPWTAYNLIVLWTFLASGGAMYLLGRGTGASRPASFLSGCAYTFSTYHFAHDLGHLHLLAMQWLPLYVLALAKLIDRPRWTWAVAGGLCLGLATLASWYDLLFAAVLTIVLVPCWLVRARFRSIGWVVANALLLVVTFAAISAPLALSMKGELNNEPYPTAHEPHRYSADLESFYLPNASQALAAFSQAHQRWISTPEETGAYVGFVLLALVLAGIALRADRSFSYLAAALCGAALSLGPALQIGGALRTGDVLPYAWLEQHVPLLAFAGVPVRFFAVATFGLAAALAPSLDALARVGSWRTVGVFGILAVLEHAPHAFVTSTYPTPSPMLEWARDPSPFVVLDANRDVRHLWHQFLHGHPIFGGYVSRSALRLGRTLDLDPVAGPLRSWDPAAHRLAIPRADALAQLRSQHVRYIVEPEEDSRELVETQLGLRPSFEGDGVRIYEIAAH